MREALARGNDLAAAAWPVATTAPRRAPGPTWKLPQTNFAVLGLRAASFIGLIAMATLPAEFYITVGTAITVAGGIIMQILVTRENRLHDERTRQERVDHQAELKLEIARVAALTRSAAASLTYDIRANSALTVEAGVKADAAYDAANHVNEKIASLQAGALPVKP